MLFLLYGLYGIFREYIRFSRNIAVLIFDFKRGDYSVTVVTAESLCIFLIADSTVFSGEFLIIQIKPAAAFLDLTVKRTVGIFKLKIKQLTDIITQNGHSCRPRNHIFGTLPAVRFDFFHSIFRTAIIQITVNGIITEFTRIGGSRYFIFLCGIGGGFFGCLILRL